MILIDTNIISEYLKREPDAGVKALFAIEPELALSVVTLEEMAYGLAWQPVSRVSQAHRLTLATRNTRDFEHCGTALLNPFSSP